MASTISTTGERAPAIQRIVKVRRDYNTWVADETIEDYALRYTARSFRKWSPLRVANTAFGSIAFLLLEAVGAALLLSYGFTNAFWAIVFGSVVIFLVSLPISWYGAKYSLDMDLLTRGAGFGYIGSTITSLIYASFTFIFFALEATIMALALKLCFEMPMTIAYLVSALVVIPLVTHGITLINRFQAWTQPLWLILLAAPYVFVFAKSPDLVKELPSFIGQGSGSFDLLMFGAAASLVLSMVLQVGEQIDFLRFLPERTKENRKAWTASLLIAGPGWIGFGALRMLGGALLAFVAMKHLVPAAHALEPATMYLHAYGYVFSSPQLALIAMTLLVVLSQLKINTTNAYAGSLAWSNFFARVTHSHPGRVVWVVFNVGIALLLMQLGVFAALQKVLGLYSNIAIAWVGALVADLVINKPLGFSPKGIEFKRAHLYDINPVGVGSMLIASVLSVAAYAGTFGLHAQAFSAFIALVTAFVCAPLIAWYTKGRYYIARQPDATFLKKKSSQRCVICEKNYETEDMALCPAYRGAICSLCCSLDVRCNDACKPGANLPDQVAATLRRLMPGFATQLDSQLGRFALLFIGASALLAGILGSIYIFQVSGAPEVAATLRASVLAVYGVLLLGTGVGCWFVVLSAESRRVAQQETDRQTQLLMREIEAHKKTDAELQLAKQVADKANQAKSRYVTGISHELRTPLNSILGYAQILEYDPAIPLHRRDALAVIRRSGEHLASLVDGLLDIAKIESGKLKLDTEELRLPEFLAQIVGMFRLQAQNKHLSFDYDVQGKLPAVVRADKKRLGQILINILGNAVKFTARGSVRLSVQSRRDMVSFEVRDSGEGIDPVDLERIFLPFERGASAAASSEAGTGLGLTIARLLTSLMGGELSATSVPGEGSTFVVRLFLPAVRTPKRSSEPARLDVAGYAGPRRRVMVVDDSAVDRRFLASVLQPIGFEVAEASSGIDALRLVGHVQPDLVLLDIGMPGMSGWETARLLRANRAAPLPIVVISADSYEKDLGESAGIAPEDFLVKPVSIVRLLDRVRERLDLIWIARSQDSDEHAPSARDAEATAAATLPEQDLQVLRVLGDLGHVRGILTKLDEIDRLDSRNVAFTAKLREHVQAFRLPEYMNLLAAPAADLAEIANTAGSSERGGAA
jgi:signal transduction histidine kinase/purine-cytosine permease-like protein/DNA-binding NarL/FixJ family response regulator